MTIKETVLPLADNYAASALVAPFSDANAHDATQARATLCAALDATDREVERLTNERDINKRMRDLHFAENARLLAENARLLAENQNHAKYMDRENAALRSALEKLARLGNGDQYGNSIGNDIARAALGQGHE